MITAKFGGTAITPQHLVCLKRILTTSHNCVVVSAIGKTHPNDIKITDLLRMYYVDKNESFWQQIAIRYRELVEVNCIDVDIDKLLFDAKSRAQFYGEQYCASLGEELSAKVVARYLNATYIEAQEVVRFAKTTLDTKRTVSLLKNAFSGVKLGVLGGFYGGRLNTRATFSRGGSDVTASYCAVATGATLYENWTDVNGVYTANPTEVFHAKKLINVSYSQMYQMARCGATVLHPDAVKPAQKASIPIKIGNYLNPFGSATLVSNIACNRKLLCVTCKGMANGYLFTVAHNYSWKELSTCMERLFVGLEWSQSFLGKAYTFPKFAVDNLKICSNAVKILCKQNILQQIYYAFDCQ